MKISQTYTNKAGEEFLVEYEDVDSFDHLDYTKCRQCYVVCSHGEKLLIGYGGHKMGWGLVGGTIEKGETFEQTLKREIQEETNFEVLTFLPVGYQKVTPADTGIYFYQLRYVCKVRPYGPFVSDPAGGITEIKLIDPADSKQYFDWGAIGDRIGERALELIKKL